MAGRKVTPICSAADGKPTVLKTTISETPDGAGWFRICAGCDEEVKQRVILSDPENGSLLATMDVLFCSPGQIFEAQLSEDAVRRMMVTGVALQLEDGTPPLWIVTEGPQAPDPVLPHLLVASETSADESTFLKLFCSEATLQPCDWMAACVWDGLNDWSKLGNEAAREALARHIAVNFPPGGDFIHEGMRSDPKDNQPSGYENHGPFAVLAEHQPQHPAIRIAEEGFERDYKPQVDAVSGWVLPAETSYAVSYPMASFAVHAGRQQWLPRALHQLRRNRELLTEPDDLYLRYRWENGERTFKNWSRGVAWYFLGMVRTLTLLPLDQRPEDLLAEANRMAVWAREHQEETGLWPCYLKEESVLPDTSGSSGIAAAIAIGVREGILPQNHLPTARLAKSGLMQHLTPDGWLKGVSQSNKGVTHAMDIQRSKFRVIAPWGMGMLAQLLAALRSLDTRS